ncbi:MarR family transcriptional regulator [Aggregicoccus sp. 17bor-14]|nr:MarR family transcriptional regulator [Simulacricoccus sp. 17bor-14]MRI87369.1 MarR family transcriptional regulator [Aggregicoccus sp. 17bor-14]
MDDVRRLVQALRLTASAAERQLGISGAQLFVLQRLGEHPGASVGELAVHTATHQSSVSVVAKRLIARGLVARGHADGDRRRAVLTLTPRGRTLLARAPASPGAALQAALAQLTPTVRRGLSRGLGALLAELGASHLAPALFFEEESRRPTPSRNKKKVHP